MLTAENLDNKIKKFWPKNGPSTQEIEKYIKKIDKKENPADLDGPFGGYYG